MTKKVYFVSGPGRIKIGFTTFPEQRLIQLQSVDMEPLSMIGIVDGPRSLEMHLHELASPFRVRREWYRDCPEVREIINRAISGEFDVPDSDPRPLPEISKDLPEYYDLKRLPILEARALASRLYVEFLEEINAAIERRRAANLSFDDLLLEKKKIDPAFIAEKHRRLVAA